MPALLNATSTLPYVSCATANARATSSSTVTSAWTKVPPTSAAALSPAPASMSTATTFAPSSANRRTVASPIPLPAPVTTAVRPASLPSTNPTLDRSDALEVPAQLPVGHRAAVRVKFHPRHRRVMADHVRAERAGRQLRRLPQAQRLVQRRRHPRQPVVGVGVACHRRRQRPRLLDPGQGGREQPRPPPGGG